LAGEHALLHPERSKYHFSFALATSTEMQENCSFDNIVEVRLPLSNECCEELVYIFKYMKYIKYIFNVDGMVLVKK
jgi:hypothetical protein